LQLEKQMKEYVKSIQSALTSIGKPTLDSFRSAGLEKGATGLKSKVIKHLLKKLGLPLPNKSQIKAIFADAKAKNPKLMLWEEFYAWLKLE